MRGGFQHGLALKRLVLCVLQDRKPQAQIYNICRAVVDVQMLKPKKTEVTDKLRQEINKVKIKNSFMFLPVASVS